MFVIVKRVSANSAIRKSSIRGSWPGMRPTPVADRNLCLSIRNCRPRFDRHWPIGDQRAPPASTPVFAGAFPTAWTESCRRRAPLMEDQTVRVACEVGGCRLAASRAPRQATCHSANRRTPSRTGVRGRQPVARMRRELSAQVSGTSPGWSGSSLLDGLRPSAASSAAMKSASSTGSRCCRCCRSGTARRRWRGREPPDPSPGRAPRRVGGADHALDDVVDIGEVAAVPAVVEDLDRTALEDGVGEFHRRHVGPAPGPVDREEAQAGAGQPVEMGVGVRHQLVRALGRGVELQRMVDALALLEGHRRVGAVDARGRGVGQVRASRPAGRPRARWRSPRGSTGRRRPGSRWNGARRPGRRGGSPGRRRRPRRPT